MGTISARHIVEQVLTGFLASQTGLSGATVYKGDSADMVALPRIIVLCDSARTPNNLPEGLGNYSCSVRVTIVTSADDETLATHRQRCEVVAGAMAELANIKAAFAADGDAYCYDVSSLSEDEGVAERNWASVFTYEVLVCVNPQ